MQDVTNDDANVVLDDGSPDSNGQNESLKLHPQGDGYRWVYVVILSRDRFLALLVLKILLFAALVPSLLGLFLDLYDGNAFQGIRNFFLTYFISAMILLALFVLCYPLFILCKGGRVAMLYELDEQGITSRETKVSREKGRWIVKLGMTIASFTNDSRLMGSMLIADSQNIMRNEFCLIKKVIFHEKSAVIRLFCRDFSRSIVYLRPEDFHFVDRFVTARCPASTRIIRRKN